MNSILPLSTRLDGRAESLDHAASQQLDAARSDVRAAGHYAADAALHTVIIKTNYETWRDQLMEQQNDSEDDPDHPELVFLLTGAVTASAGLQYMYRGLAWLQRQSEPATAVSDPSQRPVEPERASRLRRV